MSTTTLDFCPFASKLCYPDKAAARAAMGRMLRRGAVDRQVRVYRCACGFYHVTSRGRR